LEEEKKARAEDAVKAVQLLKKVKVVGRTYAQSLEYRAIRTTHYPRESKSSRSSLRQKRRKKR